MPGDLAAFSAEIWGQRALLSPGVETGADFSDLLSFDAVDQLVSRHGLRTPFIRVAKDGRVLPASAFTGSGGVGATIADQVSDDKLLALLLDGSTVVLQGLHRVWPPLIDFATDLTRALGHAVQINAYLTPANSRGFSAHYDTHDVFVLHLGGSKRWAIHDPVLANPLPDENWEKHREAVRARALEQPILDVTLRPGDVLYLPRGFLHSASAADSLTLHLTVGVHALTESWVLTELAACLAKAPELRGSLPLGVDLADPDVLAPILARSVASFGAALAESAPEHARQLAERIAQRLGRDARPSPISPVAQSVVVENLTMSTRFRLRQGCRLRVLRDGDSVLVTGPRGQVPLSAEALAALGPFRAGAEITAADLAGLPQDEQLALAAMLLREAIAVPVQPPTQSDDGASPDGLVGGDG